jgi:hypothetical protein
MPQQLNSMEDFQRDISYRLLKGEDGTATLTAKMQDRFHDLTIEIVIDAATLEILSASADFTKSPTPDCGRIDARLSGLIGFRIGKGLYRKLMEVLAGAAGCGNVRTLLIGLLPLALNLKAAAGIADEREMLDKIHEKLVGTCVGYSHPPARE